ncbi:hypothetical protein BS47DRAFT_1372310 [Hydnum rufescens UP504]|uniref:Pyridoxamine 5'-phosphate oxidase N-terminal domain-containing protein n=1 Tax=Hydnum rufescens UP504 TaxID=1448309 RepID=A0A9P6AZ79_9AGAM|nr:hypothetical protein BS47DRAFT_1372310 [Hydnum rufescens UP504]
MGVFFDEIPEHLIEWINAQHLFWVASAPLSQTGHVNISPKGVAGTFQVIDNKTVMYQDLSGSGSETIAHLRENGRITVLFQAFSGAPRIVRLFGTGVWYEFGSDEYHRFIPDSERLPGSRAAIIVSVHKVGTVCYAVPFYSFEGHRTQLLDFFEKREACEKADPNSTNGLRHYWAMKNAASVDGLPGLRIAELTAKERGVDPFALKPFVRTRNLWLSGGLVNWGPVLSRLATVSTEARIRRVNVTESH